MTEFTLYSAIVNLFYLIVTLAVLMGLLRWFDRLNGVSFRDDVLPKLEKSSNSMALYYGLRFFGVCLLASSFLKV